MLLKAVTMSAFRKEPGEFFHEVAKHGKSFLLTKAGKPVARLIPVGDVTVIKSDGEIVGELPVTFRRFL